MMHEPNLGLKVTTLHKGLGVLSGGLGAGVGFDVDGIELSLSVMQMLPDEQRAAHQRRVELWQLLLKDVVCSLFVLGPHDSSITAVTELQFNLSERWTSTSMPVVVLALYEPEPEDLQSSVDSMFESSDNVNFEADSSATGASSSSAAAASSSAAAASSSAAADDEEYENDGCPLMADPSVRRNPVQIATALKLPELKRPWVVFTANNDNPTHVSAALKYITDRIHDHAWEKRLKL